MIYRIRIILDVTEDVLRDIEIEEEATLEDLHHCIIQSFGFLGNEMASFYKSDEHWTQGEELPLESMNEEPSKNEEPLNKIFTLSQPHLIYIYDFLNLWTFFVELKEIGEKIPGMSYPNLIHSEGEVPEEAPEKIFDVEETDSFDLENEGLEEEDDDDLLEYDDGDFY